jgi:hypothetical protein
MPIERDFEYLLAIPALLRTLFVSKIDSRVQRDKRKNSSKRFISGSAKRRVCVKTRTDKRRDFLAMAGEGKNGMRPFQTVTRLAATRSSAKTGNAFYQETRLDDAITSVVAPGS